VTEAKKGLKNSGLGGACLELCGLGSPRPSINLTLRGRLVHQDGQLLTIRNFVSWADGTSATNSWQSCVKGDKLIEN
jgi:hypothetical protein